MTIWQSKEQWFFELLRVLDENGFEKYRSLDSMRDDFLNWELTRRRVSGEEPLSSFPDPAKEIAAYMNEYWGLR